MPNDSSNPIFAQPDAQLTPGQLLAKTTNGDLADYFNNPEKYEQAAKIQAIQQGPKPSLGISPAQKAASDAAYQQVLQKLASPTPGQPSANDYQAKPEEDTTELSPDLQDQYDKEMDAKQKALKQMLGNGPRGAS